MSVNILQQVNDYYSQKIQLHGLTPQGVDWNGEESQLIRFHQLMRVVSDEVTDSEFSLLDYGCGYGGMVDFLDSKYADQIHYFGFDISEDMISAAIDRNNKAEAFFTKLDVSQIFDYVVASGIFNVKQDTSDSEWIDYMNVILDDMHQRSKKGFSFNILSAYSDSDHRKDYLFYAKPEELFSYCKRRFSKNVALLHDYQLYEFTIIVKK